MKFKSGFSHSAFSFGNESNVLKSEFKNSKVNPGALIIMLQKGLLYSEAEAHINDDGTEKECTQPFRLIHTHECDASTNKPLPKATKTGKVGKRKRVEDLNSGTPVIPSAKVVEKPSSNEKMEVDEPVASNTPPKVIVPKKETVTINESQVLTLDGHTSEVFMCQWNPASSLLATCSGDSTARIWSIPSSGSLPNVTEHSIVLQHFNNPGEKKDVTTLSWNYSGTHLATGCYSGEARIFTYKGELVFTMAKHRGPIFSVKWNKNGNYLISVGLDGSFIVWDTSTGEPVTTYTNVHSAPVLEVDWKDNNVFATSSSDSTISICRVGETKEIKKFLGHTSEVNGVKWDPSGKLLASCSDDGTAKVFSLILILDLVNVK